MAMSVRAGTSSGWPVIATPSATMSTWNFDQVVVPILALIGTRLPPAMSATDRPGPASKVNQSPPSRTRQREDLFRPDPC